MSLLHETRLGLAELAKELNLDAATCWRWSTRGVKGGIKLETIAIGGRRYTSREAFERFVAATNPESVASPPRATPQERRKAIAAAEKELARAGI